MVKRDVSSAKSFLLDFISFGKSLMSVRKRSVPKVDPCGTPAKTGLHDEDWPLKKALWILPDR